MGWKLKGSIMTDFLIFFAGVFLVLVLVTTVFGKGIAFTLMSNALEFEPGYLQEEIRDYVMASSYAPGNYTFTRDIYAKHNILYLPVGNGGDIHVVPTQEMYTGQDALSFSSMCKINWPANTLVDNNAIIIEKTQEGDACTLELKIRKSE